MRGTRDWSAPSRSRFLPAQFSADPVRKQRFEREAKTISSLNHPHICVLHDIGHQDGMDYLLMECVEGETLAKRLEKGPLPIDQALKYGAQIADALDKAHRSGVVHRDLKPGNIMLTSSGAKLLDFGLAKAAPPLAAGATLTAAVTQTTPVTQQGTLVGTFQYMSPEQLEGKDVDARSDIFSFGAVLYEMVTGRRAFQGKSQLSVASAVLEKDPEPISRLQPLTPPGLDRAIRVCLAKDPENRWQMARDLLLELKWIAEAGSQAGVPAPVVWHRKVREQLAWVLAAAAMLVLGALGGSWAVSYFRQSPADERVVRFHIDPPPGGRFVFGGGFYGLGSIAISPVCKTAAYVASVNGKYGLWVRPLDASSARLLPGTEGAAFPVWAPDSKSVAFFIRGKLQRSQLAGGTPVIVSEAPPMSSSRPGFWGSDGYIIFGALSSGLFRVPASGGTPAALTTLDPSRGELSHGFPQMLPGGRFLFSVQSHKPEMTGVFVSSLPNPAERTKVLDSPRALYVPGTNGTDYLLWLRGGTLVAQPFDLRTLKINGEPHDLADEAGGSSLIASACGGGLLLYSVPRTLTQFEWFDRTGKPLAPVGEPDEHIFMFRLSPDGRRIAVQRSTSNAPDLWDLWVLDADRGLLNRFTSGAGINTHPIWSPDGKTIMFAALGSGRFFRKSSNGAGDEQLVVQLPPRALLTDWSADGRWVMYDEIGADTKYDLWLLPVTPEGKLREDDKPRPYLRTPFNERYGRFSPEPSSRWVAYQSDESGGFEIYIDTFPEPHGKIRISTAGGTFPEWGAGGRELFYLSPDYKIMAVSLKQNADSIEPSAPHELFSIVPGTYVHPYDVTRDGQRFLVLRGQEQDSQTVNVIVNWPVLLKKGNAAPN